MSKILFSLLIAAAGPVFAFDLPVMNAGGVKELAVTVPAAPAAPVVPAAVKAASQRLWMSISYNPAAGEAQGSDWNNRVEANVRGTGNGRFDVNLRTDTGYTWATISRSGSNYNIYGSGLNLNMYGGPGSYRISGNYMQNGKSVFVNVNLSGNGDGYGFNAFGPALNLFASRGNINGWFDVDQLPRKALAAVTAFILTLQVEAAQPAH